MRRVEWGFQWERRELPRGERDRFGKSGEGSESTISVLFFNHKIWGEV